jgi:hypothetical protein
MSFTAPVYPIDWSSDEIVVDEDCVCISSYCLRKMTKRISKGYEHNVLEATFKIIDATA